jgi:3-hydroxyisobutyrate dehydrogenase-like beta-hydroxyacid dehydrogenase
MKTIGMIGLGIMGKPMALNILNAGYPLVVYNRDADKCAPLVAAGAKVAATPREVAAACDITLAMVSDPGAALAVALGPDGVVDGLGAGKGYVDVSTVDAETAMLIGEAVEETGARFLEAPVSGSKKPAEDGTLIHLCGGDRALFDEALPVLDVTGKLSLYLGETGNGVKMKLVVNMIMGTMLTAFCEGVALADSAGLEAETLLKVLDNGVMSNSLFNLKGPALIKDDFPTAFPLKHMQKDMRLALALGDELGQALPVTSASNQRFIEAKGEGLGDEDFAAVHRVIK